uniref:Na_H_Exchanger domain-containing protein n=1 Tax=Heterorhabditis bacteriophora TaxID=37862 RepID=A0A1I7WUC3_HETBA
MFFNQINRLVPTRVQVMDQRYGSNFRNFMHNFFNHPQTNLLITSFILLISVYASLIAISGQNILHPFSNVTSSTFSVDAVNEFTVSTFSLFFLTILSLIVGKILHYAKIPPLCGALLVGIVVINVPNLEEIFFINKHWEFIARKLGLVNIIVRWGISINAQYISHNPVLPILLGLLSSAAEVAVIILASICIFNISTPMAILTGFLVATVSPAVSGPVMIKLNNKKLGTDKQIPSFVPAACCFDNLFCLTLFSITASATFSTEPLFPTLVRSIGEIVVGAIIGILIGWLLWWFPRQNENYTHLMRSLLLAFLSTAIIIGAAALNYGYPGIIASLLICFISTTRWRFDNEKKVRFIIIINRNFKALPVERTFNNLWNIVFTPLLFTLVGMKLKFSELSHISKALSG